MGTGSIVFMAMQYTKMSGQERQASAALALIYSLRVLGLFMILPVFTLYAGQLKGSTASLVGLALGIYGLTQATLQLPLGLLSDHWGRKRVITFGLLLFALGSVLCAVSQDIHWMIVGRALQGAGAIGSALMALMTDLTREAQRSKAMAMIGASIGTSFTLALVLGPVVSAAFSVPSVFTLSMVMGLVAIGVLYRLVPATETTTHLLEWRALPSQLKRIFAHVGLLRLNFGIFALHGILAASFVALPIIFHTHFQMAASRQWHLYLPILLLSFATMLPVLMWSERRGHMHITRKAAIGLILCSQLGLWLAHGSLFSVGVWLFTFFVAFNLLEASLPSQVSKTAPQENKGAALGVYSSCQFLGIFFGGLMGGWLYGHNHLPWIFMGCSALALLWLVITVTAQQPTESR